MNSFAPKIEILPPAQRRLWEELHSTPDHFTLYGGTALALQLGHRDSVDFDFFSRQPFEAETLRQTIPYLNDAQTRKIEKNSLTVTVDRDGPVKMQFFGGLPLQSVNPRLQPSGAGFWVASLVDVAGSKVKVLPERSEAKDYIDVDALLKNGVDLSTMLGAAKAIYGKSFNPMLSLKALSYFDDVKGVPEEIKTRLALAATKVDVSKMPILKPRGAIGLDP